MALQASYTAPSGLTFNSSDLVSQWDDETGSAHMTQGTTGNKPKRIGGPNRGLVTDFVDTYANDRKMTIPTGVTASHRNFAMVFVLEAHSSRPNIFSGSPTSRSGTIAGLNSTSDLAFNQGATTITAPGYLQIYDTAGGLRTSSIPVPISRSVVAVRGDASNYTVYCNGDSEALTTAPVNQTFTGGTLAQLVAFTTSAFYGEFLYAGFYNAAPTDGEMTTIISDLSTEYDVPSNSINVVIEGDSIGLGVATTNNRTWGKMLVEEFRHCQIYNAALSGYSFNATHKLNNDFSTRVTPYFATGKRNILIAAIGVNDLASNTAADTWTAAQAYFSTAEAAGWEVYAVTVTHRPALTYSTTTQAYNDLLIAGWEGTGDVAGLIDLTAESRLHSAAVASSTYLADSVHLSNAGHALYWEYVKSAMEPVLAIPANRVRPSFRGFN